MATKMTKEEAIKILMGYSHTSQERAALEVLIPELAESEDERIIDTIISVLGQYIDYKAVSGTGSGYATPRYSKEIDWLKSLRSQPIQLKEAYKEGFQTARHATALAFMKYCDKIKPNGKMCLSNGECEEIEKAFLVGDWEKIERYFHKCQWKPSEEQMNALYDILHPADTVNRLALESLYEQLKAL